MKLSAQSMFVFFFPKVKTSSRVSQGLRTSGNFLCLCHVFRFLVIGNRSSGPNKCMLLWERLSVLETIWKEGDGALSTHENCSFLLAKGRLTPVPRRPRWHSGSARSATGLWALGMFVILSVVRMGPKYFKNVNREVVSAYTCHVLLFMMILTYDHLNSNRKEVYLSII